MKPLVLILSVVFVGWLGLGGWWHHCGVKDQCGWGSAIADTSGLAGADSSEASADTSNLEDESVNPNFFILDDGEKKFTFVKSPMITHSEVDVFFPEELLTIADSVGIMLDANPEKTLDIEGFYHAEEENTSDFENLGLARAEYIKGLLVENGIDENRIITEGIVTEHLLFNADRTNFSGIEMEFGEEGGDDSKESVELVDAPLEEAEEGVVLDKKYLYSLFGNHRFRRDPHLKAYVKDLKKMMEQNEKVTVTIIGHTDYLGGERANMKMGQRRADYVKSYMVKNGIPKSKIETSSQGESNPIADNKTKEGRKQNRRVEILVK